MVGVGVVRREPVIHAAGSLGKSQLQAGALQSFLHGDGRVPKCFKGGCGEGRTCSNEAGPRKFVEFLFAANQRLRVQIGGIFCGEFENARQRLRNGFHRTFAVFAPGQQRLLVALLDGASKAKPPDGVRVGCVRTDGLRRDLGPGFGRPEGRNGVEEDGKQEEMQLGVDRVLVVNDVSGVHRFKGLRFDPGGVPDGEELFNGFEQAAFEQGAPEAGPGRQGQTILKGEPDDREDRLRGRFHLPLLDALRHFADQIRKRRLEFFAFALAEGLFEARGRVLPQQVVVREKFSQFGVAQPVFDDGAEHFGFFKVFARELGKRVELVECLPERLSMFRAVRQIEDPEDLGLLRTQCFRYDGKREHVLEAFEEVLAPGRAEGPEEKQGGLPGDALNDETTLSGVANHHKNIEKGVDADDFLFREVDLKLGIVGKFDGFERRPAAPRVGIHDESPWEFEGLIHSRKK